MKLLFFFVSLCFAGVLSFKFSDGPNISSQDVKVDSISVFLDAFSVESDSFPTISGRVNLINGTSNFNKSYYNPSIKGSGYQLSQQQLNELSQLLGSADWDKLKTGYDVSSTDQPTSILMIHTGNKTYTIKDRGLEGDAPLPEIYKIVYRF